ncbi:unnamed protein product [Musa textilis]
MKSSYTRVKAHILKLTDQGITVYIKVTIKDIYDMQKLEEVKTKQQQSALKKASLPPSSVLVDNCMNSSTFELSGRDRRKGIVAAFNMITCDQLHSKITRIFYFVGLPFHLARNSYYISAYTFTMSNPLSSYLPLAIIY